MKINKSILVVLALSAALTSCRKEAVDDVVPERPFVFSVNADWTKAMVSQESEMRGSGITVLGAHTAGTSFDETATPSVDFDGSISLSYSSGEGGWTYSDKRFWTPNSSYRFRAYWPAADGITFSDDYVTTLTLANFTTVADPANQPDLMLSQFRERKTVNFSDPDEYAPVPLMFEHLLCNVNVSVKLAEESSTLTFVVNQVSLNNIKSKGTYVLDYSTATSDSEVNPLSGTWSATGTELRCSASLDETLTWNNGAAVPVKVWDEGLLLIPQDLSGLTLTVYYTIRQTGKKDQEKSATLALPTQAAYAWRPATKLTYNVSLKRDDKITFSLPSVEEWGPSSPAGTILIK